jgi:hypothetical protein
VDANAFQKEAAHVLHRWQLRILPKLLHSIVKDLHPDSNFEIVALSVDPLH